MRAVAIVLVLATACKKDPRVDLLAGGGEEGAATRARAEAGEIKVEHPVAAGPIGGGPVQLAISIVVPAGTRLDAAAAKIRALRPPDGGMPFTAGPVGLQVTAEPRTLDRATLDLDLAEDGDAAVSAVCCVVLLARLAYPLDRTAIKAMDRSVTAANELVEGWTIVGNLVDVEVADQNGDIDVTTYIELSTAGDVVSTRGMAALGVPELQIGHVPTGLDAEVQDLLRAAATALFRTRRIDPGSTIQIDLASFDGDYWRDMREDALRSKATGRTTLHVEVVGAATPPTRLALVFPGSKDRVGERIVAAYRDVFGRDSSEATTFKWTPAVQAAVELARQRVRALALEFGATIPAGTTMDVEVPVDAGDSVEYVTVRVSGFAGHQVIGVITGQPTSAVRGVGQGSRVEAAIEDLLDYNLVRAGGQTEGGEVDRLLDSL